MPLSLQLSTNVAVVAVSFDLFSGAAARSFVLSSLSILCPYLISFEIVILLSATISILFILFISNFSFYVYFRPLGYPSSRSHLNLFIQFHSTHNTQKLRGLFLVDVGIPSVPSALTPYVDGLPAMVSPIRLAPTLVSFLPRSKYLSRNAGVKAAVGFLTSDVSSFGFSSFGFSSFGSFSFSSFGFSPSGGVSPSSSSSSELFSPEQSLHFLSSHSRPHLIP